MKMMKEVWPKAGIIFAVMALLTGIIYPGIVTVLAQVIFPFEANGSIVELDGKKYCTLLGQEYNDLGHMWGRVMSYDVSTYTDKNGNPLVYAGPSNKSPAGDEINESVAARVKKIHEANPEMGDTPIPVDLVTCSGSGLDPHISPAAAEFQVTRLAKAHNMTEDAVRAIIAK